MRYPNKRGVMKPSVKKEKDKIQEKLITDVSAAAAAIRDGGVTVAYSSVGKCLKNMHVVRFSAHAAELIAQLIKVIKEHVKTYTPPSPPTPALALVALLIKSPHEPLLGIATFQGTYYSRAQDGHTRGGNWIHF